MYKIKKYMNWKALYEKFKMCLCFSVFAIFVSICVCPSVSVFLVVFTRLPFLVYVSFSVCFCIPFLLPRLLGLFFCFPFPCTSPSVFVALGSSFSLSLSVCPYFYFPLSFLFPETTMPQICYTNYGNQFYYS